MDANQARFGHAPPNSARLTRAALQPLTSDQLLGCHPHHSAHAVETLDLKIVACQGSLAPHSPIKLDIAQPIGNEERSS
jgi:hypothetical protein